MSQTAFPAAARMLCRYGAQASEALDSDGVVGGELLDSQSPLNRQSPELLSPPKGTCASLWTGISLMCVIPALIPRLCTPRSRFWWILSWSPKSLALANSSAGLLAPTFTQRLSCPLH